ncbi:tRNA lysidine(34) synthetase TilS [Leminorella grimontii]|uniref:tRNA lysidine(34) synthetase TilS n=1 Tax=Leminorella grimontii TaxID=82981 RepID=UPI00208755C4|nr:tRNA lysidine(34) synthetase TilS [Leminorella grimontii]GKX58710.1 tRNA(Ile)-lysidine synthase [Leminorella grimontii]
MARNDTANTENVLKQLAHALASDVRLLVAFSGGVDSTALLHGLAALKASLRPDFSLRAVYVHHGLSQNADAWADHCRTQCERWNVPLEVVRVSVDGAGAGIEAAARDARYRAFAERLAEGETLVTAQHLDDQCETFLLALKRGSGPAGLSAMPERMPFGKGTQARPLLNVSRRDIEGYAAENALTWVDDESNQDARYDRNFLRLNVLPQIDARWPHFTRAVARSAELCAEQESLLDELLAPTLTRLCDADGALDVDGLRTVSAAQRRALLRRWFSLCGAQMPSREQLETLWLEVAQSQEDAQPQLTFSTHQVRRYRQRLYLLPLMNDVSDVVLEWDGSARLSLPDGLGSLLPAKEGLALRMPRADERLTVRFCAPGGMNLEIVGRPHSRPLKKLWQELGVPPWLRQRTPLLFYNDTPIAAVGVFITRDGEAKQGDAVWHVQYDNDLRRVSAPD